MRSSSINRRDFLKSAAAAGGGLFAAPFLNCGKLGVGRPMKRVFGRLGFETTTLGLGGQASLQWTPHDVDPEKIILKAFSLGINYFDTSNLYGPSQTNYGKAFRRLNLIPGSPGYDEKLRRSFFLTSKTHMRWAKGLPEVPGVNNWTNSPDQQKSAVLDVKRSLSQMFGDGRGGYPGGAYLDMVLIHSISSMAEVDAVYTGLHKPDPGQEVIGALAALRDYRDGTNLTGLNPGEEKLIRHIGFSGHFSPAVMMEMIQRDTEDILDGMLVAVNPNDMLYFNMQNNVLPVAGSKNMGVIGMKVFADGAMYDKDAHWSSQPEHVVRRIGSPSLPSRPLVEYTVSTPCVHTVIIGIGEISENSRKCQLSRNLSDAQVRITDMKDSRRREIEAMAAQVKEGKTNYFQGPPRGLTPVQAPRAVRLNARPGQIRLTWHTAFAGSHPIDRYEIFRDREKIGIVAHHPQITKDPFEFTDKAADPQIPDYQVVTVDRGGNRAVGEVKIKD
ncbi:aldo/keto reductase [bacterium]|nr:aldo/keto reductase [bacterium]